MASLKEALQTDLSNYRPVERGEGRYGTPPITDLQPVINPMLRCPLPPLMVTPSDSLRQFYMGGQVPQMRMLTPPNATQASGTQVIVKTVTATAKSTTVTGNTAASNVTPALSTASATTPSISPNGMYRTSLSIAKAFQLINASSNGPCRIRLYGTAAAQSSDLGRDIDVAPLPGTQQNLITDIVLDSSPYVWSFQHRVGSNQDSPQIGMVYLTVTNVGSASQSFSISIGYASTES